MTRKQFEERNAFEMILADESEGERTESNGMDVHERRMRAKALARLLMRHAKTHARRET